MDPQATMQGTKASQNNQDSEQRKDFSISVTSPEFVFEGKDKHIEYLISGVDPKGQFSIQRRYRQFYSLRANLIEMFPGVYIPPIPSKRLNNTDSQFIEERCTRLNYFCQQVLKRQYLFRSVVFQSFLRDAAFQKSFPALQLGMLQSLYEEWFSSDVHHTEAMRANEEEYKVIMQLIRQFQAIRSDLISIAAVENGLLDQQRVCLGEVMSTYEGKFLSVHQPTGEKVFALQKNQVETFAKGAVKNSKVKHTINTLSSDLHHMRALAEAIEGRRMLQATLTKTEHNRKKEKEEMDKLQGGKTTFKSIFTAGSKEQQAKILADKIKTRETEGEILIYLIQLSDKGIYREIKLCKQEKKEKYIKDIQKGAQKEIEIWAEYADVIMPALNAIQT